MRPPGPGPALRFASLARGAKAKAEPPRPRCPLVPAPSASLPPLVPQPLTPSPWGGRVTGADRCRRPRDAGREPALGSPSAAGRGPALPATHTPPPPPPGHPPRVCFPSRTTGQGREGDGEEEEEEKEAGKLSWSRRGWRESGIRAYREGEVVLILLKFPKIPDKILRAFHRIIKYS